jgi:hypothetical protein
VRVEALTPEATASVDVATLKLDGRRVALCCRSGRLLRVDARRATFLGPLEGVRDFVLDAEERGGDYQAFDALMAEGRDLRGLALADRLRAVRRLVGELSGRAAACRLEAKPFFCLRSPGCLAALLRDSRRPGYDGLIFSRLREAYEAPSLKFKQTLTVDFCLERAPGSPAGAYQLLTQNRGQLKAFLQDDGQPCRLLLTSQEREKLGVPEAVAREDAVVVECELPRRPGGQWRAVRRREDRERPNCLRTVLDTLGARRRRMDCEKTLLRAVPEVSTKAAFLLWRDVLQRRLLWALEELEQQRPLKLLRPAGEEAGCAEGAEPECFWSAFDLDECGVAALLERARRRLEGAGAARRPSFRALVLFQSCAQREALQNLSYFGLLLGCEAAEVLQLARASGFAKASLLPLEPRGAPQLLALPPHVERLAASSFALSVEVKHGKEIFSEALEKLYESVPLA